MALVKKKVLVMARDPKSFFMDFFLPILLIFLSLYVSTIDLLSQDYPTRMVSAYGFPHGQPLVYNLHSFNQTEDEIQSFIDRSFSHDVGQDKLFSRLMPVDLDLNAHFFDQAAHMDDIIFELRHRNGAQYGG